MNTICCLSFHNQVHLEIDFSDYTILNDEWFAKEVFKNNFHVLEFFLLIRLKECVSLQLAYFLENYIKPDPIINPRFDARESITIGLNGQDLILDLFSPNHFKIHLLNDLFEQLRLTIEKGEKSYLIPRKNFSNEYHLPLIYRIKYLINQGIKKKSEIEKHLSNEFNLKISIPFISEVIDNLNELDIIKADEKLIEEGKYFNFFY
jgi:hypothetical protein